MAHNLCDSYEPLALRINLLISNDPSSYLSSIQLAPEGNPDSPSTGLDIAVQ